MPKRLLLQEDILRHNSVVYMLHSLSEFYPGLRIEREGVQRMSPYRIASLAGASDHGVAWKWLAGTRRPTMKELVQLLREVIDYAEHKLAELETRNKKLETLAAIREDAQERELRSGA